MGRRSDHSREDLKKLITSKAIEIVAKDGFKALTARKLAADIGYTPGTIYNLFQSMDGVALAVSSDTLSALHTALSNDIAMTKKQVLQDRLKSLAECYYSFIQENTQSWLMLFDHKIENGEIPDWFQDKISALFKIIEDVLTSASTPPDNVDMMARTLWSSVHGLYVLDHSGKLSLVHKDFSVQDMAGYLIEKIAK